LEDDTPAALFRTPPAGAPFTAQGEQGLSAAGAARRSARRTQALPRLSQPRSRGWPQLLLVLLVLWLLVRVGHEREPLRKLSSAEDMAAGPPGRSTLGSPPASGTSARSFSAPSATLGQSPSAPEVVTPTAGALERELQTATASRVQLPKRRGVLPAPPRRDATLHRLHIRAKQEAQLLITIDGQRTIEFHLRPGQVMNWSAKRDFTLTSKNGGEVALTLNGRQVPPLGNARQRVRYIQPSLTVAARQPARYFERNSPGLSSPAS